MITKKAPKRPTSSSSKRTQHNTSSYYNIIFQTDDSMPSLPLKDYCSKCFFGIHVKYPSVEGQLIDHNCNGLICLKCLQQHIREQYEKRQTLSCPLCGYEYSDNDLKVIYPSLAEKIETEQTENFLIKQGGIPCRFCANIFFYQRDSAQTETTFEGRPLTDAEIKCCSENYICCNNCHISTCLRCKAVPYHKGETCEEHKWYVEGYVCRICGRAADPSTNKKRALLVCTSKECQEKAKMMCNEIHMCGHACCGTACNGSHPLCPLCTVGGSLCPHCKKPLWGELCYRLSCGHTIHKSCAIQLLAMSSRGPQLTLPICPAPGCGVFVFHPDLENCCKRDIARWHPIMDLVEDLVTARIDAEGIRFHPDVSSKLNGFAWAGDEAPRNWAKKKMRFMICNMHSPPCVYTDARLEDPPCDISGSCPMCSDYKYPLCDTCGYKWMQNKCQCCCSVGVRHSAIALNQQRASSNNLWYCEICREMPHRTQCETCKGNCKFAPHPNMAGNFYAYCGKCNKVYTKQRCFQKLQHK